MVDPEGRDVKAGSDGREQDPAPWPEDVEPILGGDLCVAFGYLTPAGGAVVLPVTTVGMHDSEKGTVTTTSSFGLWKKFTRIERDPHVALAYHAREHGLAQGDEYVLVQGQASFPTRPDLSLFPPEMMVATFERLLPMKTGKVWRWIGREYYEYRVPITVEVERVTCWHDDRSGSPSTVSGVAQPSEGPPSQEPPSGGTSARVSLRKVAKRLARARHTLLGYRDSDGAVTIRAVTAEVHDGALRIEGAHLPAGCRRAGLLAHWFEPRLDGQGAAVLTGWFECEDGVGRYFPHTDAGYAVPTSALLFHLGSGLTAKMGYRKAVKLGLIRDGEWQTGAFTP